jgi:hypothetical protein
VLPNLGKVRHVSNDKARTVLGWIPRSSADAVAETAETLQKLGLLPSPVATILSEKRINRVSSP